MNCAQLKALTGWDCSPSGDRSILATSPLTLGEDGQHLAFYIAAPDDTTFYLTDACHTAMQAAQMGVEFSKSKIDQINATYGVRAAHFNKSLEITAEGRTEDLQEALWDATKLALSLSFNSKKWMPKFDNLRFRNQVQALLEEVAGHDRLLKSVQATGMSGHTVEFPFAVRQPDNRLIYIEPVAAIESSRIHWSHIYQVMGKMMDVKQADTVNARIVVLEDVDSMAEYGKAATILSQCATVKSLGTPQSWQGLASRPSPGLCHNA